MRALSKALSFHSYQQICLLTEPLGPDLILSLRLQASPTLRSCPPPSATCTGTARPPASPSPWDSPLRCVCVCADSRHPTLSLILCQCSVMTSMISCYKPGFGFAFDKDKPRNLSSPGLKPLVPRWLGLTSDTKIMKATTPPSKNTYLYLSILMFFYNLLKLNHFIYIQEEIYEIMGEEVNLYLAGVNRLKEN